MEITSEEQEELEGEESLFRPTTLAERMERWGLLQREADRLRAEIEQEVLVLKRSQQVGDVHATFSKGRGHYDYENLARRLELAPGIVERHTTLQVDWKSICEEASVSVPPEEYAALKTRFYQAGQPSVSLKLKLAEEEVPYVAFAPFEQ